MPLLLYISPNTPLLCYRKHNAMNATLSGSARSCLSFFRFFTYHDVSVTHSVIFCCITQDTSDSINAVYSLIWATEYFLYHVELSSHQSIEPTSQSLPYSTTCVKESPILHDLSFHLSVPTPSQQQTTNVHITILFFHENACVGFQWIATITVTFILTIW